MLKQAIITSVILSLAIFFFMLYTSDKEDFLTETPRIISLWNVRSVDTVKFSRDLAREKMNDPEFDLAIQKQISDITSLGASHVAIGTPYDSEFTPFLKRWVNEARRNNLKVWFRGNFSGWENWFNYPDISREQHKNLLVEFIKNNPDLFEDGDIFTSCPECENGGPGDPRFNGDVAGHRKFLIEEYSLSKQAFKDIGKQVSSGYYSMNYDVANLVMDEDTTNKLGNLVVIDHYIKDAKKLAIDAKLIADKSKGEVVLGEFGAPIPDIHGTLNQEQQAAWIKDALSEVKNINEVVGVNYWTNVGGSTGLWNTDGSEREIVNTIRKFYQETKLVSPR